MNGPSQPSGDRSLQVISPPEAAPGKENGVAVPVALRKSRPVSMDARIQVSEEMQVTNQGEDLSPAANQSQKASQSRPNSSALETLGGEKLANGSLELRTQAAPGPSRRDSDCGSLSTSESMVYSTSLSADLSLNRETGSLSIKVRPLLVLQVCSRTAPDVLSSSLAAESIRGCFCFKWFRTIALSLKSF